MSVYKLLDLQTHAKTYPHDAEFVPLGTNYDVDVFETPAGPTGRIHEVYNTLMPTSLSITFHLTLKNVGDDCFVKLAEQHKLLMHLTS